MNSLANTFLVFLILPSWVIGQSIEYGSRPAALAHSLVALPTNDALYQNPSALSNQAIGFHFRNRFLIREASEAAILFTQPLNRKYFICIGLGQFGFEAYHLQHVLLGVAKDFQRFKFGLSLTHKSFSFGTHYNPVHRTSLGLGLQSKLTESLQFGLSWYQTLRWGKMLQDDPSRFTGSVRIGFAYYLIPSTLITLQYDHLHSASSTIKLGLEYSFKKQVHFRFGIQSKPLQPALGLGYQRGRWKIDLASAYHQQLGFIPQTSLIYAFKDP